VTAEEPAPAKPAVDLTAQFATPAHAAHPASIHAATTHAAPVSAAQPVPVNALAVEIAAQARAGNSRFEIRLDPPELGRIDVRLDVDHDGNVTSRLVIERADTYDLLRRDQSTLERALQQAGLKTSDNALEFSLRDQGFARHRNSDDLPHGLQIQVQEADTAPGEAASGYARLLGARGGIDIRV
jgi:flagellar hook-length control protein FliK